MSSLARASMTVTPGMPIIAASIFSGSDSTSGGYVRDLLTPLESEAPVYVIKDDQVRWVPTYDATLIVLVGLSVVRALVSLVKHGRRRNRALAKT